MTREEFIDIVYSELHSDDDNCRANRIIDAADEYAEKQAVHYMAIEAIQNEDREDYEKVMEILREMPRLFIGIKEKQIKKLSEAVEIVRCKECRHASECHKRVQYRRQELNTVTIRYSPIEWCSKGERREP